MNKLLARGVAFLNGLIAFVIIVVGTMLGTMELHVLGLVRGAILGFIRPVIASPFAAHRVRRRPLRKRRLLPDCLGVRPPDSVSPAPG